MNQLLRLRKYTIGTAVFALIAVSIVATTFVTTKDTHAALAKAPYTTAELNAKLYGGVQQAIDWDKVCYDGVREERKAGHDPRQSINGAPSYQGKQWLSLADTTTVNNSSRTAPIVVDYGTKTVPLQLNMVKFLCAGLVSPDGAGADYKYTDQRVVRVVSNANDRKPNPMGGNTNWPALTDTRFRIDNIQVVQGDGHITGTAVGKYIGTARQENTRYWFATPTGFNFVSNSPDGLTSDIEVKIKFTLRGYNTYYNTTYQCYANNLYTYPPDNLNINKCNQNVVTLSVMIHVNNIFDLTPTATLNQTSIEAGGTANVKNTVAQTDVGPNSNETDWRLTELDYAPGKTLTTAEKQAKNGAGDPCGAFTSNGRVACNTVQRNDKMVFKNPSTVFDPLYGYTAPGNIPPGTKVCFVASVSKPTPAASPVWRHSAMVCMTVSKKPKVQIWGGDIAVRGNIETSTNIKDGKTFGSWVEYGAFSVGTNTRFASGSGTNGNQPDDNQAAWSKLTFANKDDSGADAFGEYTTLTNFRPAPGVASYFGSILNKQPVGAASVDLNNLTFNNSDPIQIRTAGNLTITGGNIPPGKSVVIIATGTVSIEGDINYSDAAMNSINDIPQVVIISKDINIKDSVKRVDSWLVASGTINTCNNFAGKLTIAKCSTALVVNGPVVTNKLVLNRTAGADVGDPAERFNLRPDAYLWAQLEGSGSNKAQTVYSVELPPRF
jgi:hypothetical protein